MSLILELSDEFLCMVSNLMMIPELWLLTWLTMCEDGISANKHGQTWTSTFAFIFFVGDSLPASGAGVFDFPRFIPLVAWSFSVSGVGVLDFPRVLMAVVT